MQVSLVNPLRKSKETSLKVKKELQTITQKLKKHKSQDTYLKQSANKEISKKYLLTEKSTAHSKELFPQNKISTNISPRLISPNRKTDTKSNKISPRLPDKEPFQTQTHQQNTHLKLGSLDKIMSDNESYQEIDSDEIEDKQGDSCVSGGDENENENSSSIIDETEMSEMNCLLYSTNANGMNIKDKTKSQKELEIHNNIKYHINKFPTLSSNPFMESNEHSNSNTFSTSHKNNSKRQQSTNNEHNNNNNNSNSSNINLNSRVNNNAIITAHTTPTVVTVNLEISPKHNNNNNNASSPSSSCQQPNNTKENELDSLLRNMLIISKKGDKESLLDLLEKILHYPKPDLNFKDENGFTALHYACDEGNFKIVDILIKSNCDVNSKTITDKKTPLHLTAKHGFFDISKLLIENGAVINIGDNEKNTPLHLCAQGGHVELMKYFLDKLPQADTKNIYGKTPRDVASKNEIKELLKEYLGKKDNVYRNIKIHTASESTLNYMMKKLNNSTNKNKVMFQNTQNHININIQTNYNNNSNSNSNENGNNNNEHNSTNNNSIDHITSSQNIKSSNVRRATLPSTSSKLRSIKKNNPLPSVSSSTSVSKKNIPHPKHHINNNNINPTSISTSVIPNNNNNNPNNKNTMSKKNSISNFSMNSQLTNRKITPNPQKQNLHKTRTLQKFVTHHSNPNTSKKDTSSSSSKTQPQQPKTNTSTSSNQKININNISVDINDPLYRLNKTEEFAKPYKTNPNDITNPDDDNNSNTNNNSNKYNQVSLGSIEEERITLTSFICLAMLGKGSFGEVYLVQKMNSKVLYAMKVLSKDRIMGQNLMKYAMAERNVLSLTNHPFIVKLNFAFQTNHKLFLILDYCPGGDLSKHLQYEKRFTEERARFYLCEIILALEDLHRRDIIFRDLKPDNVVLDNEGHAKLTDFGLSKEGVYDSQCAKSFCGSIAYLAPEMLKKQGHGKAVDWYLLGVLFYEMLVGIPPFFTDQKEEIFRNIEHGELIIPKKVSKEASALLRCLLQRDPNKRLGSGPKDALEIKEHKYFKKVNWDDVYNKKIVPPKIRNYSKHLQMYNHPRMFQADEQDYNNVDTVLPGWSFINNDDI